MSSLPAGVAHLLNFTHLLRGAGFTFAPEQSIDFLYGVSLMGPRTLDDVRRAARATLALPPDRFAEFDAIFHAWAWGEDEILLLGDETQPVAPQKDFLTPRLPHKSESEEDGDLASSADHLGVRRFAQTQPALEKFSASLSAALPRRRSFRSMPTRSRGQVDLRRSMRSIIGSDGDIPHPVRRRRSPVQRKLLLLIDISGSMKLHTEDHLKLAHALVQNADHVEVLTLGTRLTHITLPLRVRDRTRALQGVAGAVADWDGGTRIGPSLLEMLKLPRFAAFARGACVIVLSDALERGSADDLCNAMRRLSLRAHRLSLCTPLAADPRFAPKTAALSRILPMLDDLVDGSSSTTVANFILRLARPARSTETLWRKAT
jgi:uncharacterized protein with von Willebrand factor type A (vWA) domain